MIDGCMFLVFDRTMVVSKFMFIGKIGLTLYRVTGFCNGIYNLHDYHMIGLISVTFVF
jgi:hypothetical protein